MKISTSYELYSFLISMALGLSVGIFYDLLRAFAGRKHIFRDLLFWIASALFICFFRLIFLSGEFRWYLVLGASAALLIYFLLFSNCVFSVFSFTAQKIYAFFALILKILLTVKRFLGKILLVYVKKIKLR